MKCLRCETLFCLTLIEEATPDLKASNHAKNFHAAIATEPRTQRCAAARPRSLREIKFGSVNICVICEKQ